LDLALGILTAAQILVLILGGVVVYYASRAYRKTRSGAMLFLAIGFGFVVIGAAVAGVLYNLNVHLEVALAVQATSQVVGFLAIVYSLTGTKD
jgi:zinc transporter ZupT